MGLRIWIDKTSRSSELMLHDLKHYEVLSGLKMNERMGLIKHQSLVGALAANEC